MAANEPRDDGAPPAFPHLSYECKLIAREVSALAASWSTAVAAFAVEMQSVRALVIEVIDLFWVANGIAAAADGNYGSDNGMELMVPPLLNSIPLNLNVLRELAATFDLSDDAGSVCEPRGGELASVAPAHVPYGTSASPTASLVRLAFLTAGAVAPPRPDDATIVGHEASRFAFEIDLTDEAGVN